MGSDFDNHRTQPIDQISFRKVIGLAMDPAYNVTDTRDTMTGSKFGEY